MDKIIVSLASQAICEAPHVLTSVGLGACVCIVLHDTSSKISGIVTILLPESGADDSQNITNRAKFADTAIPDLVRSMIKQGAQQETIVAKLAGGAHLFDETTIPEAIKVGLQNILMCRQVLTDLGIKIVSESVGGTRGRSVELYSENGSLLVKTVGAPNSVI